MMFSTFLVILLFATPNADAQSCSRWNHCYKRTQLSRWYERTQQQDNSGTFVISNQTLDETNKTSQNQAIKIEELQNTIEKNKDEMNNTIFSQSKQIQLLENIIHEQIERINKTENILQQQAKQIEIYSKITESLTECHLPDIKYMNPQTTTKIPNNSTVHLSCSKLVPRGIGERTCKLGKFHPDFHTHPFYCGLFDEPWDEANAICKDLGTTIITDGIDTTEQRKKLCKEIGLVGNMLWTGITKTTGEWKRPDGRSMSGFDLDWKPGYPIQSDNRSLVIWCIEGSHYGKIMNYPKRIGLNFLCQN